MLLFGPEMVLEVISESGQIGLFPSWVVGCKCNPITTIIIMKKDTAPNKIGCQL